MSSPPSYPLGAPGVGATAGSEKLNLGWAMAFRDSMRASQQVSKTGQALQSTMTSSSNIAKGMNQSFQGMQAKGSVIQKIVASAFDTMAVGTSQMKKDVMGAFKKGFAEGDFASMVQALIDIKTQFIDFKRLAAPLEMLFKPFNILLTAVGQNAAAFVATSDTFKNIIAWLSSEDGVKQIETWGKSLGQMILRLVNYDWTKVIGFVNRLMDNIERFVKGVENWREFWGRGGGANNVFSDATHDYSGKTTVSSSAGSSVSISAGGVMSESMFRRLVNAVRTRMAV